MIELFLVLTYVLLIPLVCYLSYTIGVEITTRKFTKDKIICVFKKNNNNDDVNSPL